MSLRSVARTSAVLALVVLATSFTPRTEAQTLENLGTYCFRDLTYSRGYMYFFNRAVGGPKPRGLYRTDSTLPGTILLTDQLADVSALTDLNGILLFVASHPA